MKNPLLLDNAHIDFFEPYYLYDTISVYDKVLDAYVPRRRSVAISFSSVGEIAMATTICSAKDAFVKKDARVKLNARLYAIIKAYFSTPNACTMGTFSCVKGSHVFIDYSSFIGFCNTFDSVSNQYFLPYRIQVSPKPDLVTKNYNLHTNAPSNVYFHRVFIEGVYDKFMSVLARGDSVNIRMNERLEEALDTECVEDIALQEL